MIPFSAILKDTTELENIRYRFYDADGDPIGEWQTSGIRQNSSGRPIFPITCTVPAGALSLEVEDTTDASNWAPITLNFARGDSQGAVTLDAAQSAALAAIRTSTGTLGDGNVTVISPVSFDGGTINLIRGDDYFADDGRALRFTQDGWPDLTGAEVTCTIGGTVFASTVDDATVIVELTAEQTNVLIFENDSFYLRAVLANEHVATLLRRGRVVVRNVD